MRALDDLTEPLDWAMGVVRHLESVATYPELRAHRDHVARVLAGEEERFSRTLELGGRLLDEVLARSQTEVGGLGHEHLRVRPDGRLLVPRRDHHGRTDQRAKPLGKRTAPRPPTQSDDAITQQLPRCVGRGHTATVEPLPLQVREVAPFVRL